MPLEDAQDIVKIQGMGVSFLDYAPGRRTTSARFSIPPVDCDPISEKTLTSSSSHSGQQK